jgi:hypothetical protein
MILVRQVCAQCYASRCKAKRKGEFECHFPHLDITLGNEAHVSKSSPTMPYMRMTRRPAISMPNVFRVVHTAYHIPSCLQLLLPGYLVSTYKSKRIAHIKTTSNTPTIRYHLLQNALLCNSCRNRALHSYTSHRMRSSR